MGDAFKDSRLSIFAAIGGNAAVAVIKFVAAALTGSSAMISEGIHSLVDTGNGALLLFGQVRSERPPDALHPFGHGKELYFWSLIVAISIFGIGGGMSVYEGILHILEPVRLENAVWSLATLGLAAVFEGGSLYFAVRGFRKYKGGRGWYEAIHEGKDPSAFTVLFEDSAALLGLSFAALGIWLTEATGNPVYDGAASVAIGLLLASVAILLASESRGLLLGESASDETVRDIHRLASEHPGVSRAGRVLTMQMGPSEIIVDMQLRLEDGLTGDELRDAVRDVDRAVRQRHPEVTHVFVEAIPIEGGGEASSSGDSPGSAGVR